jgi:hypothetical protein
MWRIRFGVLGEKTTLFTVLYSRAFALLMHDISDFDASFCDTALVLLQGLVQNDCQFIETGRRRACLVRKLI